MYCRNCGKELDDKAVVCVGCGVPPLKGSKHCQKCGKEVDGAAEACVSCGAQLATASAAGAGDEKMWGMLSHILMIVAGFIGPLIVLLVKGNESEFAKDQAKEALNFFITVTLAWIALAIVGGILTNILFVFGILFMLAYAALGIGALVLVIMAGIAANNGTKYRYPFALRLIK